MMSFGNVKDISKVLIWFVMYFFCYSPTDFFAFFCWSCCLLHFYQLTEKCVTSGSQGGAIIKFQFQVSFPRKDFRLPLFDPYLWSLTMVPLCTLLYSGIYGRPGGKGMSTFHLIGLVYPPSCPCYDTLGRVMCQTTLLLRTMKEIIKTKKC